MDLLFVNVVQIVVCKWAGRLAVLQGDDGLAAEPANHSN
jgi:hypothetical protein